MWLKCFCFLFVLSGVLFSALPPAMGANGRDVIVVLETPLLPQEGVALRFVESGHILHLQRTSAREFSGFLDEGLIGQSYQIHRTPSGAVEAGFKGQGVPHRTTAKVKGPHWVFSVAWSDRLPPSDGNTVHGNVVEEVIRDSEHISGERKLRILLPEGYEANPEKSWPLVYFLDGQNLYDAAGAFGGLEWSLDEVAGRLALTGGPEAIFVGIDNGCANRIDEYTFCAGSIPKKHDGVMGGGAARHLDFIRLDVDPLVRKKYRVDADPAVIVGSSLGGLFGLWATLAHPETFKAVGALSPSIWWAEKAIVSEQFTGTDENRPRLWVDMGTSESEEGIHHLWLMFEHLKKSGFDTGKNLRCVVVRGGAHNESHWADRLPAVLRYLLAD